MYGINNVSDSVIVDANLNPIDYDKTQELNREEIGSEDFKNALNMLKESYNFVKNNQHRLLSHIIALGGSITSGLGVALMGATAFNENTSPIGIKFLIEPNYPPIYDNYFLGSALVLVGFITTAIGFYLPNEDKRDSSIAKLQEE